jgi:diguanylate cyclase (GGDEF)-like protein
MLQDDTAFVVAAQTAKLYQTVTRLIWQAAVLWFVTFGLLIAASFFYIFRYAHNQLGQVAKSRDEYKSMAYLDKMTGAYSRMFLEVWDNEQRPQILISTLIIIDIDDFKQVNDKYGHLVGDKVIITVAEAAAASIRQNDHLIRFGGDEFLILLENAGAQDAQKVVSRMEAYIAEITAYPFRITFSYGIAALDRHESLHDKLQLADDRMYDAKNLKKRASAGTEGE